MHMGMVIEIAGMGVEHGMGTSAALQLGSLRAKQSIVCQAVLSR